MEKYKKRPSELYSAIHSVFIKDIDERDIQLYITFYSMFIYVEYMKKYHYSVTVGNLSYMKKNNPGAFQKLLDDFYKMMEKGQFKEKECANKKIYKFLLDSLEPEKRLLLLANEVL